MTAEKSKILLQDDFAGGIVDFNTCKGVNILVPTHKEFPVVPIETVGNIELLGPTT